MVAPDTKAARIAGSGVTVVALTAAVISFEHVRTLALRAGERELTSWLLPISIDGAIAAAVAVLLADSRAGRRPAALTWLLLGLGLASSLAANVASAEPTATARAVAGWPPLALALGIEVLAGLFRRSGGTGQVPARDLDPSNNGRHMPAASPAVAGRIRDGSRVPEARSAVRHAGRQKGAGDDSAIALIRQLDESSERRQVSRLEIQKALGCGGSRAARLARLARQPEGVSAGA
jgi:hypothetical protein